MCWTVSTSRWILTSSGVSKILLTGLTPVVQVLTTYQSHLILHLSYILRYSSTHTPAIGPRSTVTLQGVAIGGYDWLLDSLVSWGIWEPRFHLGRDLWEISGAGVSAPRYLVTFCYYYPPLGLDSSRPTQVRATGSLYSPIEWMNERITKRIGGADRKSVV